jgi:hypothetical protein
VLDDGIVLAAWCHDVVTDARLRIGVLQPAAERFEILERKEPTSAREGAIATILPVPGESHVFDVASTSESERQVFIERVDVRALAATAAAPRRKLLELDGQAVVQARMGGGYWVLARVRGDDGGVFLYQLEPSPPVPGTRAAATDTLQARRVRLAPGQPRGTALDTHFDLAVRPDGRPVAVWFRPDLQALEVYAP